MVPVCMNVVCWIGAGKDPEIEVVEQSQEMENLGTHMHNEELVGVFSIALFNSLLLEPGSG